MATRLSRYARFLPLLLAGPAIAVAQSSGTLQGQVTLQVNGDPVHNASVLVVQLSRRAMTDLEGRYVMPGVPPGKYSVLVHMHPLADERQMAVVAANETCTLDFRLSLAPVREEVTVTASGREETTLDAFQSVSATEGLDLAPLSTASLGEALEHEAGVAKRSFGPGTSRPVVRGFDGDRVLILQDGLPTGTLSSQSGDHGEPFDVSSLDRVEVVRGPATLLYGANAVGGVVNVITQHHQMHEHAHPGVRGFLTASAGSANALGGGNGGFELGLGKWLITASGGGLRTGDYATPLGTVENSHTKIVHTGAGLARFGDRQFWHFDYGIFDGRYGIPVIPESGLAADGHAHEEGPVDLQWRRQNVRLSGGLRNLGPSLETLTVHLNYSDWHHNEMVEQQAHTRFFNGQFSYRGVFEQRRRGRLSGSFGFSGVRRRYRVAGEEALTPPVSQTSFGVFALEEFAFERVRFQFGGRAETNRYSPDGLRHRAFTGASGSAGTNVRLWTDGAFVASYSNSYRAPALEELYNTGPHAGNMAYEIGDPNLRRERSQGIDLSLRHAASRVRGELNFFHYRIADYVFMDRTGEVRDGLVVAAYRQGDARYQGAEARVDLGIYRDLWLNFGVDSVDARLRNPNLPLPRIPPVRGRLGFDARYKALSVRPEWVLSGAQTELSTGETRTAGYGLVNLLASYTIVRAHALHSLSLNVFNCGNMLYRNHLSLIKDYAPEIGRGARFAYTIRFF